jgi:hypothetical protein
MNDLVFRIDGRLSRPIGEPYSSTRVLHPTLSAAELGGLAQRIAATDGVSPAQARRQIAQFIGAPSGPKVMAMRQLFRHRFAMGRRRRPGSSRLALTEPPLHTSYSDPRNKADTGDNGSTKGEKRSMPRRATVKRKAGVGQTLP